MLRYYARGQDVSGLEDDFTHKAGPLPVWAWGVIGAVGVIAVQKLRKPKATGAATPNIAADPNVADPGGLAGTAAYDASYGSVLNDSSYGSAGGQSIPVPLSGDQFNNMLSDYLQGHGYTPSEIAAGTMTPVAVPTLEQTLPASGAPSSRPGRTWLCRSRKPMGTRV